MPSSSGCDGELLGKPERLSALGRAISIAEDGRGGETDTNEPFPIESRSRRSGCPWETARAMMRFQHLSALANFFFLMQPIMWAGSNCMEPFVFSASPRKDVSIRDWHLASNFSALENAPEELSELIKN